MRRNLSELRVLIVEDNVRAYALLAQLLSFMGIRQTEWRRSGWEILEFVRDTMPHVDLVFLDIHLPEEEGYEVLARLHDDDGFEKTRVIAITDDTNSANLCSARAAGFDAFLARPLNADLFPDQLRRILDGEPVWYLG
jgi:two-component system cell cycle response regulator DivK